ncbi:MAG TPA: hypothetical protein VF719_06435 [Abditibacteriaceae bacterium]
MKSSFALLLLMFMAALSPRAAHADLGFWSARLVGIWRHPASGDVYRFDSNATYTYSPAGQTSKNVIGSSGYWKIVQPTDKESGGSQEGPVALLLKQRKLVLQKEGRRHTRNSIREKRLVVDTTKDRNLYKIDGTIWKRVK